MVKSRRCRSCLMLPRSTVGQRGGVLVKLGARGDQVQLGGQVSGGGAGWQVEPADQRASFCLSKGPFGRAKAAVADDLAAVFFL